MKKIRLTPNQVKSNILHYRSRLENRFKENFDNLKKTKSGCPRVYEIANDDITLIFHHAGEDIIKIHMIEGNLYDKERYINILRFEGNKFNPNLLHKSKLYEVGEYVI